MKVVLLTFAFLLPATSLFAQQGPSEWERVYTFDDSIIEMNTSKAVFGGDITRVRFRWTFGEPEVVSNQSPQRYKSKIEAFEINCSDKRYRTSEITLFDTAGKTISSELMNPLAEWRTNSGLMMGKLIDSACELKARATHPHVATRHEIELEKVSKYALSFSQHLEKTRDIKPLIKTFFAKDYLTRYLHDQQSNWFWNLDRATALQANRAELQRFYVALLNTGYLNCVYFTSQYRYAADGTIPEEKLIPGDILKLIDSHPFTAKYKGRAEKYDYLGEKIDSVERLRSYTDLLERISVLMRTHVLASGAEQSRDYQAMLEDWDLYQPKARICTTSCLGLPKGTSLFEVNVPVFHLQIAEFKGELRVMSVTDLFH